MKYLIPIFLIIFWVLPLVAEAQSCQNLDQERSRQLCYLIDDIAYILQIIGIMVAIIMIIIAGIQYTTAGGDEAKITRAKRTLTYGLLGAAIIFLAYFIVNLLEDIIVSRFGR